MSLIIKSFSQDVDVSNPKVIRHFMVVFDDDRQKEVKLPVPEETTKALIQHLFGEMVETPVEEPEIEKEAGDAPVDDDLEDLDPPEDDPTVFGGDGDGDDVPAYTSEDDVPSL